MKTLLAVLSLLTATFYSLNAAPVTFEEVSLLVRMREPDAAILQSVSERKLLRALTPAQEAALKRTGASNSLLVSLRAPRVFAAADEVAAYDTRQAQQREARRRALAAAPIPAPAPRIPRKPATGHSLVIDRIVLKDVPVPRPFVLYMHVEAGRSKATYHIPGKRYATKVTDGREIEVPINLTLDDVEPNSWATVDLHLDIDDQAVTTFKALKQHTARIQILDYPQKVQFSPDLSKTPFSYDLVWHSE